MNFGMDYQGDAGGGGFAAGSQPGSGGRNSTRRSPDEQTVLPVTIAMMLTSQTVDERPQLQDGRFLHRVRFVAAVRNFEDMSTNILYEVEDGTGMIEVQQWLDDQKENAKTAEMRELTKKEHVYLKITGQLKDYNGKKKVVADGIRPLTTGNELAHHMLEVVYVEQKQKEKQQQPAFTAGFGQPAAVGRPLQPTAHGQGDTLREQILAMIKGNTTDQGLSLDVCIKAMSSSADPSEIRNMFDILSQEGIIYSTVDENHFQCAF
uniref:Replication protein A C-terminal domain-containing protein n=1 Tax=Amphora coffeiformis TaxID=265554 RepID=A0A7S3LCE0_9STRA|mmetsp:Transcript_24142/g.45945  ORF Transcript_24142/g.45945 Transcript_24142/m.45945 type:complete len:263 (+) Transcript_24142:127-915(+)